MCRLLAVEKQFVIAAATLWPIFAPEKSEQMATTTADIQNGLCFKMDTHIWKVIEFLHVKPGKGPAFVRTKLKNLNNGKIVDHTFNSGVKIDVVRIETREYQFLYKDENYNFMNLEDFEQISIPEHMINAPQFLKEGMKCIVLFNTEDDQPMSCDLPTLVEYTVVYTEPGIRGDTATNTFKPAKLDIGVEVRVPLFINEGDAIRVDTSTGQYHDRVKK
jgi:elongation factor P